MNIVLFGATGMGTDNTERGLSVAITAKFRKC